jgi:hypothetical protein
MALHDDPQVIWAAPGEGVSGNGSHDEPYTSVRRASERLTPGATLALKGGVYRGPVSLEIAGAADRPIRVMAAPGEAVIIQESSWYLYDSSDVILSGLRFVNAPETALSIIGACQRNCFDSLQFKNCGSGSAGGSAIFFGGAGARCNVVQNCEFTLPAHRPGDAGERVGVMVSEGDESDFLTLNRNLVFRKSRFVNYDFGVIIGSRGSHAGRFGHVIEHNVFDNCRFSAIRVNCGDITIRNNYMRRCAGAAIAMSMGSDISVLDNRIEECGIGIEIMDRGHTVQQNCLVRCATAGIDVRESDSEPHRSASNVFIEQNTFYDCGFQSADARRGCAMRFDAETSSIVRRNIMHGEAYPYRVFQTGDTEGASGPIRPGRASHFIFDENIVSGGAAAQPGCVEREMVFAHPDAGDFSAETACGAQGWAAESCPSDRALSSAPDAFAGIGDESIAEESEADELIRQIDRDELMARSMLAAQADREEAGIVEQEPGEIDEEDDPERYFDRDDI